MKQLITPTPIIPAQGGWCLQYVRQAYGLPARYASATEAWDKSTSKHRDRNFPAGLWTPVWYGIAENPLGHVVLLAPDGSCYSTSDYSGWPVHHNSLADLESFYAYYNLTLQYRGWTEDVAGYAVIGGTSINANSITKADVEEFLMALPQAKQEMIADRIERYLNAPISNVANAVMEAEVVHGGSHSFKTEVVLIRKQVIALSGLVAQLAKNPNLTAEQITKAVQEGMENAVVDVDITVSGKPTPEAPAQ
ncbi:membrane associated protein [Arthrobacter phage Qui]|uniref:Peptidase n=1 Tax=Arthrobacter phage Qui TaxID=2603260 RepID=A0A5B8WLM7_9CAUD|nr:membrane associated protein [Arthrobacter phage Qui]QED11502.1 peptidase [Arthrobacter phage Qui]QOC56333.1 peptidase [Arthrobacter phage Paella]